MINKYFIFKIKDEFLPITIREYIQNGKICSDQNSYYNNIYYINQKYLRKLKIQNIENTISEDEKIVLEFLINTDLTQFLTQKQYEEKIQHYTYGHSGTSGAMGTSGWVGVSGFSGANTAMTYQTTYHLSSPATISNVQLIKSTTKTYNILVYFRYFRKIINRCMHFLFQKIRSPVF